MASMDFIGGVPEVARAVGLSERTLRDLCRQGRVAHAQQVGRRWVVNATREWPHLGIYRDSETGLTARDGG